MRWRLFWTRTPNHQPRMLWSAPDQRDPDRIPDRIPDRMSDTMSICQKECQNIEYAIICNIYFQAVCENYVRIVCQVLDHSTKVIYGTPLEPWQLRAAEKAPVPSRAAARFPSRAQEGLGAWYVPDVPGFGDEFCLLVASWVYDIHEYNLRIYIYIYMCVYIYILHTQYLWTTHIFATISHEGVLADLVVFPSQNGFVPPKTHHAYVWCHCAKMDVKLPATEPQTWLIQKIRWGRGSDTACNTTRRRN